MLPSNISVFIIVINFKRYRLNPPPRPVLNKVNLLFCLFVYKSCSYFECLEKKNFQKTNTNHEQRFSKRITRNRCLYMYFKSVITLYYIFKTWYTGEKKKNEFRRIENKKFDFSFYQYERIFRLFEGVFVVDLCCTLRKTIRRMCLPTVFKRARRNVLKRSWYCPKTSSPR